MFRTVNGRQQSVGSEHARCDVPYAIMLSAIDILMLVVECASRITMRK